MEGGRGGKGESGADLGWSGEVCVSDVKLVSARFRIGQSRLCSGVADGIVFTF